MCSTYVKPMLFFFSRKFCSGKFFRCAKKTALRSRGIFLSGSGTDGSIRIRNIRKRGWSRLEPAGFLFRYFRIFCRNHFYCRNLYYRCRWNITGLQPKQCSVTGAETVFFLFGAGFCLFRTVFFFREIRPKITGLKTVNEKQSFLLFLQRIGAETASLYKKKRIRNTELFFAVVYFFFLFLVVAE